MPDLDDDIHERIQALCAESDALAKSAKYAAIGNPFLHLRLGQCHFELGNLDGAADELARAYMSAGDEIFVGADKYFAFLKTRLEAPPGEW